ncbi:MAG: AAA family ATPase, partial [Chloroflexales bacterium]|nr:AAA family ATPase [Chloroflexales bacterium]
MLRIVLQVIMQIQSITIKGFRCFDAAGQSITLDHLTCFVGPNASGKTTTMVALARLFGESQSERTVKASDFHVASGEELTSCKKRHLSLEAILVLPELEKQNPSGRAIAESFNQMVVDAPGETPYCRILLEATWENDGTPMGDIQQKLYWILTSSDDPAVVESKKIQVRPTDRAKVRVVYVPASRDPSAQIRSTTTTVFGRLLRALEWGKKDEDIRQQLQNLKAEFARLPGLTTMNVNVQAAWKSLYDGPVAANVAFESIDANPSALLDLLAPTFTPDEQGKQLRSAELSDGLRALFALSLPLGLYYVEALLRSDASAAGFCASVTDNLPSLTLFAVEEPENHLSPHYLGKVVGQLLAVSKSDAAQVVLSSHSPSIMGRIDPDHVRYFLGGETRQRTQVRALTLPQEDDEAFKYVREAIRGYPELYFARLVVLGEGPSEEIVLRRLFEASGAPLDAHFISVVPLGGRHVNHFWRLLNSLGIPFITLLDLDREKEGAGWGRIQYIRNQLVDLHGSGSRKLVCSEINGVT